jgi:hypothetical protein
VFPSGRRHEHAARLTENFFVSLVGCGRDDLESVPFVQMDRWIRDSRDQTSLREPELDASLRRPRQQLTPEAASAVVRMYVHLGDVQRLLRSHELHGLQRTEAARKPEDAWTQRGNDPHNQTRGQ